MGLRKILADSAPPIDEILVTGVLPRLITFLDEHAPPLLQFESCWCLSNIASGTTLHTTQVAENGALVPLVRLLAPNSKANEDLKEQCVWAISNITGESSKYRDEALYLGAFDHLVDFASKTQAINSLRVCSWAISNLFRGGGSLSHLVSPELMNLLENLVQHSDPEIKNDAILAMRHIAHKANSEVMECIVDHPALVKSMVELMVSPTHLQTVALQTICSISCSLESSKMIIDFGVLPIICDLFRNPEKTVRLLAFFIASNIAVGSTEHIQQMINHGLYQPIFHGLTSEEEDIEVKRIIVCILRTSSDEATPKQIDHLVKTFDFIPSIIDTMFEYPSDKITLTLLETFNNIMDSGEELAIEEDLTIGLSPYQSLCGDDIIDNFNKILKQSNQDDAEEIEIIMHDILKKYHGTRTLPYESEDEDNSS